MEHLRTLIAKELELGFLYINAETRKHFPKRTQHILLALDSSDKFSEYQYNATHNRIFGLLKWYKKQGFEPKAQVQIYFEEAGIRLKASSYPKIGKPEYSADEVEQIVDLSGLSSMAKGDIVEDRIKEIILLYGQGNLSVYKPVSDNEGIDLIVVKNGVFQPLFLQVKGRFKLYNKTNFIADVRLKTFNSHHTYFVVGAYFNPATFEIDDHLLFLPSEVVKQNGTAINAPSEKRYRIMTNLLRPAKSKWAKYIITKQELVNSILEKFVEMEKYLR